jgi:hypothetical protein
MNNVIITWNEVLLQAIRVTKPGPPMAARSVGIVYTAVYDAWAAYDANAVPVHSTTARRPAAEHTLPNKQTAVSFAAYNALKDQFPAVHQMFTDTMTTLGLDPTDTSTDVSTPVGVGNVAWDAVRTFRHNDGANQLGDEPGSSGEPYSDYTGYHAVNPPMSLLFPAEVDQIPFPDRWQPLTYLTPGGQPATPAYIAPHWGLVKPFALATGDQFRPPPPARLTSQNFLDQSKHVIQVQANLTPKQKVIAEYWADGPNSELPPGHWMIFTSFVAQRDHMDIDATVKLFFSVGNAIFDASIATWEAKRFYDYARPVTTIRHLFRGKRIPGWGGPGQGTVLVDGEAWRTFQVPTFPTPPFAEYTSGHSAFSMAAAEVLKRFTQGDHLEYYYAQTVPLRADPTEPVLDVVLRWKTFTDAAREAGESRLYGGIHFCEGNVAGLELGRVVGEAVYNKAEQLWNGTIEAEARAFTGKAQYSEGPPRH